MTRSSATSEPLSLSTVFDTQLHEKPQEFKALGLGAPCCSMTSDYVLRPVAPAI